MNKKNCISKWITVTLCTLAICASGIGQNLLDMPVKDINGEVYSLRDHIDPSSNYIIEAMAFWCAPCRRSMDDFTYHQAYWKERFNTEIILIDDEHYDDIPYVENEMQEGNWDLNILLSDEAFSGFGINSYPSYYFIEAQSDSIYEISSGNERFLLEKVDSIYFNSNFDENFQQTYISEECSNIVTDYFNVADPLINIADHSYYKYSSLLLRERDLNGDLMLLDPLTNEERIYIKYSAPLCSEQVLTDVNGNDLEYKVLEKYQVDGVLHILTDRMIYEECTGDEKSLELIQGLGTNAGLKFDIIDNKVRSRLICHQIEEESTYEDEELSDLCVPLALDEQNNRLEVNILPNPSSGCFQIIMPFPGMKKIELYTTSGKMIYSIQSKNDQLTISDIDHLNKESIILCKVISQDRSIVKRVLISTQ